VLAKLGVGVLFAIGCAVRLVSVPMLHFSTRRLNTHACGARPVVLRKPSGETEDTHTGCHLACSRGVCAGR